MGGLKAVHRRSVLNMKGQMVPLWDIAKIPVSNKIISNTSESVVFIRISNTRKVKSAYEPIGPSG